MAGNVQSSHGAEGRAPLAVAASLEAHASVAHQNPRLFSINRHQGSCSPGCTCAFWSGTQTQAFLFRRTGFDPADSSIFQCGSRGDVGGVEK